VASVGSRYLADEHALPDELAVNLPDTYQNKRLALLSDIQRAAIDFDEANNLSGARPNRIGARPAPASPEVPLNEGLLD